MKARGVCLPLGPDDPGTTAGEAAEGIIDAAVRAGILTPKAGAEAGWLMRLELQAVQAAGSGELALDEETLSRAAPAEQLVSSDITGSRNTDLVGEE